MSSSDQEIQETLVKHEETEEQVEQSHPTVVRVPVAPESTVPPGFDFLVPLDEVFVKQEIELFEVVCGCETNNKYSVKDPVGREIYRVREDTSCCTRTCCGRFRPFTIIIDDFEGHEIIVKRRLAWNTCWCPCWLQKLKVYSPADVLIGSVVQQWTCCSPKFLVYNEDGYLVCKIKGPCCTSKCCSDINFKIYSPETKEEVGCIAKKWGGFIQEGFTDADNFVILFPPGSDPKVKAVLIGACLLLDFMYFERSGNKPKGLGM